MDISKIISFLPYSNPFLFVDELEKVDEEGAKGTCTFPADAYFYKGHFKGFPVTPGVILTECMAQIGLVCLGIYLLQEKAEQKLNFAMTSTNMHFYIPVLPDEKVTVTSEKEYFRFNKLKCRVFMHNSEGKLVSKGEISGMAASNE